MTAVATASPAGVDDKQPEPVVEVNEIQGLVVDAIPQEGPGEAKTAEEVLFGDNMLEIKTLAPDLFDASNDLLNTNLEEEQGTPEAESVMCTSCGAPKQSIKESSTFRCLCKKMDALGVEEYEVAVPLSLEI